MRVSIVSIKQFLTIFLMIIAYQQVLMSQGTDISQSTGPGFYIGLDLRPSQSNIKSEPGLNDLKISYARKSSLSIFAEIGYFFSEHFGLFSGIGLTSDKTQLTLDNYENTFTTRDSETESYDLTVTGKNIIEMQSIGFLSIPVKINLRLPFSERAGIFFQTGLNLSVPIIKNYNSTGTFTYTGYYPAYNVVLIDLPKYGFQTNKSTTANGKLELNQLSIFAGASAGMDWFVQDKLQVGLAVFYDRSLSNISKYANTDKFHLSSGMDNINSIMGGAGKATIQSVGLNIFVRYYLR